MTTVTAQFYWMFPDAVPKIVDTLMTLNINHIETAFYTQDKMIPQSDGRGLG